MGTVISAMFAIFVVGVVVLAVVAGWHHLAGSATVAAIIGRRRFHLVWQVNRIRLSGSSWTRSGRRHLATRMSEAATRTVSRRAVPMVAVAPVVVPADPGDLLPYEPVAQRAA